MEDIHALRNYQILLVKLRHHIDILRINPNNRPQQMVVDEIEDAQNYLSDILENSGIRPGLHWNQGFAQQEWLDACDIAGRAINTLPPWADYENELIQYR